MSVITMCDTLTLYPINLFNAPAPNFSYINFNIILISTSASSKRSHLFIFFDSNSAHISEHSPSCYIFGPSHSPWICNCDDVWLRSALCSFLQFPLTSTPLFRKFPSALCSQKAPACVLFPKSPSLCLVLKKPQPVSCSQKAPDCVLFPKSPSLCLVPKKPQPVSCSQKAPACVLFPV
jgi:hypothetical protein